MNASRLAAAERQAGAAARDAMRDLRDVAAPLELAQAKLRMLAEPQLLADPWHATYAVPATMVNSYAHIFAGAAT